MTQIEALRFALLHITRIPTLSHGVLVKLSDVETAIKAALEAKDEPVANNWSVFNTGAEVWDKLSLADAVVELTPSRLERGWSAVCVINKDNPPLYTTPPQRKPLSDEELFKIWLRVPAETEDRFAFARAIEAAHGIKGEA